MALEGPKSFEEIPPISKRAADLAQFFGQIALTKFRFKLGCVFILLSLALLVVGHLRVSDEIFAPEFKDHSWKFAIGLFIMGGAFAGREVISAFAEGIKSFSGKP
jgi:hypothetical protein